MPEYISESLSMQLGAEFTLLRTPLFAGVKKKGEDGYELLVTPTDALAGPGMTIREMVADVNKLMGKADALLGGATYSTADTVRPALQLIKTKPGNKIVSSCFIMVRPAASGENEVLAMADCAINIKPNEDELVEICKETVSCAKIFGVDPKVAFLSYSTLGSGKGEDVDKMRNCLLYTSDAADD